MQALELKQFLINRPRKPFRLKLTDGKKLIVKYPDLARLTWEWITVCTPEKPDSVLIKNSRNVELTDIVSAEFIESSAKPKPKKIGAK